MTSRLRVASTRHALERGCPVLLLRRVGWHLMTLGASPLEHVQGNTTEGNGEMVKHEWGIEWDEALDLSGPYESKAAAEYALALSAFSGRVVSRWVRESPWKAE